MINIITVLLLKIFPDKPLSSYIWDLEFRIWKLMLHIFFVPQNSGNVIPKCCERDESF